MIFLSNIDCPSILVTGNATFSSSITQGSVISSMLKTNGSGTLVAAVAGTDYVAPSALSGYLPLSGGTLTGALSGTSLSMSGEGLFGGAITDGTNKLKVTGPALFSSSVTAGGTITASNLYSPGNLSVGNSNLTAATAYIQSNSGSIPVMRVQATSTEELWNGRNSAGSITSTITSAGAATFSSSVTALGGNFNAPSGGSSLILANTGAQNSNGLEIRGGTAGTTVNWKIEKDNTLSQNLQFTPSTANGGTSFTTPVLSLSSTGAITASSSVTAGGFISSDGRTTTFGYRLPDWQIYNTSGGALAFNNYTTDFLSIASSGAITASSSVTASGFSTTSTSGISINSGDGVIDWSSGLRFRVYILGTGYVTPLTLNNTTGAAQFSGTINSWGINVNPVSVGTSPSFIRTVNTGGDIYFGIEGSTNGGFFTGSTAYATVFYGNSNPIQFILNGTKRFEVNTSGVSVTGTGTFSGTVNVNGSSTLEALNVNGNIALTGTANRYVQIGSNSNYYWRLKSVGDNFQINMGADALTAVQFVYPTGAASFASSITAVGAIGVSGTASYIYASGTGSYIHTTGTGSHLRAGLYTWMGGSGGDYGSVGYNVGYTTTSNSYTYAVTDKASFIKFNTGGFEFWTAPSGTAGTAISPTLRASITEAGVANFNGTNIQIGLDAFYTAHYNTLGFGGLTNGNNRIFASSTGADGIYIASATSRGIFFRVNGGATDNVTINSSGNMIISTTTASTSTTTGALVVSGGIGAAGAIYGASFNGYTFNQNLNTTNNVTFNQVTATLIGISSGVTVNYNNDSASTYQMLWGSGNYVYGTAGIYCNPSTDTIYANGNIIAYASSDSRYKDNQQLITNPIGKLLALRGMTFTWNNLQQDFKGNDYGLIYQDVAAVMPEITQMRANGYGAIKYEKVIPLLVEVGKNHEQRIQELEDKLQAYENKFGKLN